MEKLIGVLKVKVIKGINLVVMDTAASDPHVIIAMGSQSVFDKDTFTGDDHMGDADIDIKPYIEYLRAGLANLPEGHIVHKVTPNRENCLAEESPIIWKNGKLVQHMFLRLKNAATGEVEIQLEWVDVRGCKGLGS